MYIYGRALENLAKVNSPCQAQLTVNRIFAEHLYIFLSLNFFISIYAIFNFYCNIFLLVHAERSLIQSFGSDLTEGKLADKYDMGIGYQYEV